LVGKANYQPKPYRLALKISTLIGSPTKKENANVISGIGGAIECVIHV